MDITVNGQRRPVPRDWREDSLLQVLREPLGLVGTRLGCGVGLCGARTVLLDGRAGPLRARPCSVRCPTHHAQFAHPLRQHSDHRGAGEAH